MRRWGIAKEPSMDDSILTTRQAVNVAALRVLRSMPQDEVVSDDGKHTVADIEQMVLRDEWKRNGVAGVALIESQASQ